jgi:hypothetical protein
MRSNEESAFDVDYVREQSVLLTIMIIFVVEYWLVAIAPSVYIILVQM